HRAARRGWSEPANRESIATQTDRCAARRLADWKRRVLQDELSLKPLPALGKSRGEVIVTAVVGVLSGRQLRGRCSRPFRAVFFRVATEVARVVDVSD